MTPDNDPDNGKLLNTTRKALDDSIEHLDAATLSALNQARHRALDNSKQAKNKALTWLPATGLVAGLVAVIAINSWQSSSQQLPTEALASQYDDLEILTSSTDLDLLEDMDFVTWLVDEADAG